MDTESAEISRLLSERERLITRNTEKPSRRNETRIWNINLRLAEMASASVHQ